MRRIVIMIGVLCMMAGACKNKKEGLNGGNGADSTKFFPVNNIILEDVKDIQKTPYFIYKITTVNKGKRDSTIVSVKDFERLAQVFLEKDITTDDKKGLYRETSFHDVSTKTNTLSYTSTDTNAPVQQVLVLINDATDKVKSIFIHANTVHGDTSIAEQLLWKRRRSFQINRILHYKGGEIEERNYINWNDKD